MPEEKSNILLVEDDGDFRNQMVRSFGKQFRIVTANSLKAAAIALDKGRYDLVLLDLSFDDDEQLEGLAQIRPFKKMVPGIPIIVVTKDQSSSTTVKAMREGADDFIRKDEFDIVHWTKLFEATLCKGVSVKEVPDSGVNFIGESEAIKKIKDKLVKLSTMPDYTVLILGETGVGKEVAAQYLHQHGARSAQPFQAINLSAVSKSLMESSLFGHRKGAFTDAKTDQKGAFEKANGGVLFLDEIGEIDHDIQVKLLRFLQDKIITPVGGKDMKLDVQIVTATNRDLSQAIKDGSFREDLYYRLATVPVLIPPLRVRKGDVELLLNHYLQKTAGTADVLSPAAKELLLNFNWPGNVRQLVNIVRTICFNRELEGVDVVDLELLPSEIKKVKREAQSSNDLEISHLSSEAKQAAVYLEDVEAALRKYKRKGEAAEHLNTNLDNLKYRITTYFEKHPELFKKYPITVQRYKLINT